MKETSSSVNQHIKKELSESSMKKMLLPPFHDRLDKPKLRSLALRLSYEIVGNAEWVKIAPICAAIELLDTSHYASDDILDGNIGDKNHINNLLIASHILYSISQKLILSLKGVLDNEKILSAVLESNKLHMAIQKGFYNENFIINNYSIESNIERLKNYTFWDSLMAIGAILGNATSEELNSLRMFGKYAGIAYTLANDTCDIAKTCEDLHSAKITLPLYFALKNSDTQDRDIIQKCMGKWDCSKTELDNAVLSIIESGAIDYMRELADKYAKKAIQYLSIFPDTQVKELLIYTTRIVHNNKLYNKIEKLSKNMNIRKEINEDLKNDLCKILSL